VILFQAVGHQREPVGVGAGDGPMSVADLRDGWSDGGRGHAGEQAERGSTALPAEEIRGGRQDGAADRDGGGFGVRREDLANAGGEIRAGHRECFAHLGP
jgi:hypothetical protein